MALPPGSYAIKSVHLQRYLLYKDETINNLRDILQFSGVDSASPNAQFEVEVDEDNHNLVHIKSSRNGKYWTRAGRDSFWIVAGARKQHTDQNSWSCTLFSPEEVQPQPNNHELLYRFLHVESEHFVESTVGNFHRLLNARQRNHTADQIFSVCVPASLALKSETNNKYLRYIHQDIEGVHGILQFSGEEVLSPYAKFQFFKVEDPVDNRHLVHIRSCYNNKYWRRADQNSRWIIAGADEGQADQNLWSCTLFEYININSSQIQLRHVHSGDYLKISPANECLFISQNFDVFRVIDRDALVIFPKHLAFKVDVNGIGNYLRVQTIDTHPYLQFSATDPTERQKENKVVTAGDGSVRIMSTFTKKFWRRNSSRDDNISNNWIWADSDDTTNRDSNTLFRPVKVENPGDVNVAVALRNLGNNNFCNRNNDLSCLTADPPGPGAHLKLGVEELVMSRTIYDLNFRLADARIYNREIGKVMAIEEYENPAQIPASPTIGLIYKDKKTSTWNTSADDISFMALIQTTLTSDTPFVVQDEGVRIRVLGNFNGAYQWGQRLESETTIERRFPVVVEPRSRVKVILRATKALCDIPFSYSQRDTLISQTPAIITCLKEGGLYSGESLYNFYHTTEPLLVEPGSLPAGPEPGPSPARPGLGEPEPGPGPAEPEPEPGSGPAEPEPGPDPVEPDPGAGPAEPEPEPGSSPAEPEPGLGPVEPDPGQGPSPAKPAPGSGPTEPNPESGPTEPRPGPAEPAP